MGCAVVWPPVAPFGLPWHPLAPLPLCRQEFTLGPKRVGIMLRREYSVGKKRKQGVLPHR